MDEVCKITNKNQSPSGLAKYHNFCTGDPISFLHFEKTIGALHRKTFLKRPLFTTFSQFLKGREACNISNKC